jgi:fatty-acyl-CoA synthase
MRAFADRFAPAGFRAQALMPAYGMADATLAISFHPRGSPLVTDRVDAAGIKAGRAEPARAGRESAEIISCGPAFDDHELRILGEHGEPLPERRV